VRAQPIMLAWLGHLGRWSLLDVYFALLMMIVLYEQGFEITINGQLAVDQSIACYPEVGIYIFPTLPSFRPWPP
jgi:hypothetical protein